MTSGPGTFRISTGRRVVVTILVMVATTAVLGSCAKNDGSKDTATPKTTVSSLDNGSDRGSGDSGTADDEGDDATGSENGSKTDPDGQNTPPPGSGAAETFAKFPRLGELTTAFTATNEFDACTEAHDRLKEYRSIALEADVSDLQTLHDSLFEFEQNLYTAADGHDWGDRMIEQLVNVRRLWSTASSYADDPPKADRYAKEAIDHLDGALAVDCPR